MAKINREHVGSSLDDLLAADGTLSDATAIAVKRVLAWEIMQEMDRLKISKAEMARRMETSRSSLDRLLDPTNVSVTLQTMSRAATLLGKKLRLEMV
jgi:antitoxin HicB